MHWIDWSIVGALVVLLFFSLTTCRKYVKCPADFLAANRCAGRYLLTITNAMAAIGAISIVAKFEQYYAAGFTPIWWGFLNYPVSLTIAITGWVIYRLRETRCLTMAQFLEVRYSRPFRVYAGFLGWLSGIMNYGIFPAVSVRFFIYFCRLPDTFRLPGIPFACSTYACLLFVVITTGVLFAISGGQIAVMVTDFIQGIFCNIAFLILMAFLVCRFKWPVIFETLERHAVENPSQSLFNPFDTNKIAGFNFWFFLAGIALNLMLAGTWQGQSGYNASSKTPHEGKMGSLLGVWRGLVESALLVFIPVCAHVFYRHPDFAAAAAAARADLGALTGATVSQATVPLFLAHVLPVGLIGLFAAVMFAAMLSTDDTYMHSWGSIFVQDIIIPLRRKPLTERQHILFLRLSIIFVGVFAFFFSLLFRQTQYILLFFAITGAIFTGGAGAVLIGGLYSKTGTSKGAWTAMTLGSGLALSSIWLQQSWESFAPWLAGLCGEGSALGSWLMAHQARFPFNSQLLSLGITALGYALYFIVSWIDRRLSSQPAFDLDMMLHRGVHDTAHEHLHVWDPGRIWRAMGLNREFTKGDRVIFFAALFWGLFWFLVFIVGTCGHFFFGWQPTNWLRLWKFYVMLGFGIGSCTTIWFIVGGLVNLRDLFRILGKEERNHADNGTVVNGHNAGE